MSFIEDFAWLATIRNEYPKKFHWTGLYTVYIDTDDISWPIHGHIPSYVMDELELLYKKMLAKYTEGTK